MVDRNPHRGAPMIDVRRKSARQRSPMIGLRTCLCAWLLLVAAPALAETDEAGAIHWAYGSVMGTGWYSLDGERDVYVLRIPPKWRYQGASIDADGHRRPGIEFRFPVTLGLHRIEEFDDFLDLENFGTVSFTPGVEVEYPLSERWWLRAYGHLGWGREVSGSESAWMYDAGIKSRFALRKGQLDWAVVSEVFVSGYDSNEQVDGSLGGLMLGADFAYPVAFQLGLGQPLNLTWDVTYSWYADDLTFRTRTNARRSIDDEWRIGLALARRDGPVPVWLFNFSQIGLAYRFSSDGAFRGITVNFSAPFGR